MKFHVFVPVNLPCNPLNLDADGPVSAYVAELVLPFVSGVLGLALFHGIWEGIWEGILPGEFSDFHPGPIKHGWEKPNSKNVQVVRGKSLN